MNDASLTEFEREFYGEALSKATAGPESTGYGRAVNQRVRFQSFANSLATVNLHHENLQYSLLDVGCGTGDLLEVSQAVGVAPSEYVGIDRDERMIEMARRRFAKEIAQGSGSVTFAVDDAVSMNKRLGPKKYDVVACIATFALKPIEWGQRESLEYIKEQILSMAVRAEQMVFVTLFSNWKNNILPTEMNVNPATVFDWAMQEFGRVRMDHSYAPHDFSLTIYLDEGDWWKDRR